MARPAPCSERTSARERGARFARSPHGVPARCAAACALAPAGEHWSERLTPSLVVPDCSTSSSQAAACAAARAGKRAGLSTLTQVSPRPSSSSNRSRKGSPTSLLGERGSGPTRGRCRRGRASAAQVGAPSPARGSPRGEAPGSEPGAVGGSEPSAWPKHPHALTPRQRSTSAAHRWDTGPRPSSTARRAVESGGSGAAAACWLSRSGAAHPPGARPTRHSGLPPARCPIHQVQPPALLCHPWRVLTRSAAK